VGGQREGRDVYLTENPDDVAGLLEAAIAYCAASHVAEVRRLGGTFDRRAPEIIAHYRTGASAGPTEAMNLLIEKIRRVGHGFRNFHSYRLRLLLYCGVDWPPRPNLGLRPRPRPRSALTLGA
jgi:transposase